MSLGLWILGAALAKGAFDTYNNNQTLKENRRQHEENMARMDKQEAEAKANLEKTERETKKKQKDLQDRYSNMKTNLYSGDINGVNSDALVANTNKYVQ